MHCQAWLSGCCYNHVFPGCKEVIMVLKLTIATVKGLGVQATEQMHWLFKTTQLFVSLLFADSF
jgi:hypothetical protein